jgi:OmpA-OmpF porin, OOP family
MHLTTLVVRPLAPEELRREQMKLRSALLAATIVALPFAASAQPVTGLYMGLGAGVNLLQNENLSANNGGGGTIGKLQSEVGFAGVLSLGWGFGNGLRAELEGDYRNNHFNNLSGTTATGASIAGGGREQKFGPMVNVLYDFSVAPWVMPYLGVGIGWQAANWQNVNAYGGTPLTTVTLSHSSPGSFAYQAIVGAAFPLPFVPGLAITTEYRFMGLAGNRAYSGTATVGAAAPVGIGVKSTTDYNHAFLVGIRYNFGVAPPPPPPAPAAVPAQAPARSYLVFFDWDKATLTDRARQIIADAAANSTKVQYTRIEVNGYTDTSGTPQYNQGLSVRRASAVKAELIKDGVPANAITTQGFGETHLLVPTGPGVREPQNRRVEIIIH